MCLLWTVGRRYDNSVRISGISRYTPEVMVLETFTGPIPCISTILALDEAISCLHKAIPGSRIETIGRKSMHDEGMRIKRSIWFSIFPGFTAVETANKGTCFNGRIDTTGLEWIGRHPANMMCIGTGWKAPGWSGG